jgi:NitT/TauT family transport system substrate-binding protein
MRSCIQEVAWFRFDQAWATIIIAMALGMTFYLILQGEDMTPFRILLTKGVWPVCVIACAIRLLPTLTAAQGGRPPTTLTQVTLQLQWVTQSQFAGYYAAVDKGFYQDEGLAVAIKVGAVDIVPQQVVASGGADFGIAWLPKVLASREQGAPLVNIAQVLQRSGTLEMAWKDTGIATPADWRGKKVGTWGYGQEPELFAAMRKVGIDPNDPRQVTIVPQPFEMALFLHRQVDAAQAMIYNEYAQVLEALKPQTGQLYQPEDLHVVDFNEVGTAMLQDGVFVREDWLAVPQHRDTVVRFLRASFKGWLFCRDHFEACIDIVLQHGPTLGKGHMTWMLNEINALIWPSPLGLGIMDPKAFAQTAQIAQQYQIIKRPPDAGTYRTDLAQAALEELHRQGFETQGLGFTKRTVQITKGGE